PGRVGLVGLGRQRRRGAGRVGELLQRRVERGAVAHVVRLRQRRLPDAAGAVAGGRDGLPGVGGGGRGGQRCRFSLRRTVAPRLRRRGSLGGRRAPTVGR